MKQTVMRLLETLPQILDSQYPLTYTTNLIEYQSSTPRILSSLDSRFFQSTTHLPPMFGQMTSQIHRFVFVLLY